MAAAPGASAAPAAKPRIFYASPEGRDLGRCQEQHPCSLAQAQEVVRHEAAKGKGDVTVVLADGVYRIDKPLEFRVEDGGRDGHTVRWTAAPGAHPVISGGRQASGWQTYDQSAGIYVADIPVGLDTRQLYVNGKIAQRASKRLALSDVKLTATGMTLENPALAYLADVPGQNRIEFEALGDFTDRYSPVQSIEGRTVTMAQPAWDNNTWGWDTAQFALLGAPTWYLVNSLSFLDEIGEWYADPAAGKLYYKPAAGVDPDDLKVEVPQLESLVSIGGTYDEPVTNLELSGLEFTGTSWLGPSTHGYANQQNGAYLRNAVEYRPADSFTSCSRGCEQFERTRNMWFQEPAAVQVSAASDITLSRNVFTNLGSTALGIGNDANAHTTGVGLGASDVRVLANTFYEIGGHGIAVGGVRADAHHPSDPRMTNQDISLRDNTVNRVSVEYKDNSGILSTYVTRAQIVHNEVANVAYDGIDTGYGWGINDPGGSQDYVNRGYYKYNPLYTTPTTLKDNLVSGTLVHNTKARFADGGNLYNLSASPGTVVERNYLYNASGVGLYLDEGTRHTTYRHNVLDGTNPWVFTNAYGPNNTADNTLQENWLNSGGAQIPNAASRNNRLIGNVTVSGANWPDAAWDVICSAGVAPEYRTALNANLFGLYERCGQASGKVAQPLQTDGRSAATSTFTQSGSHFGISAAGADVWGGGGQRDDQYGAIYAEDAVVAGESISARVDVVNDANRFAKSGVMLRNDVTAAGVSPGYAVVAVTPRAGVLFEWDANGDGYLESEARADVDTYRPLWVKLTRTTNGVSAAYSFDGVNYRQVGTEVPLPGAAAAQDGAIFSTSHDKSRSRINVFSEVALGGPLVTG
ncbi:right-handed parallel beta-helix repeat-containing protein [Micromonospora sp. NPDC050686]|uniref:right-handed parallel beta-helix repeat-containing protein n=1 Tax=Micromonospora sp. NPDC050686 TaxID=3154631 RepID=UPI0033FAD5B1